MIIPEKYTEVQEKEKQRGTSCKTEKKQEGSDGKKERRRQEVKERERISHSCLQGISY